MKNVKSIDRKEFSSLKEMILNRENGTGIIGQIVRVTSKQKNNNNTNEQTNKMYLADRECYIEISITSEAVDEFLKGKNMFDVGLLFGIIIKIVKCEITLINNKSNFKLNISKFDTLGRDKFNIKKLKPINELADIKKIFQNWKRSSLQERKEKELENEIDPNDCVIPEEQLIILSKQWASGEWSSSILKSQLQKQTQPSQQDDPISSSSSDQISRPSSSIEEVSMDLSFEAYSLADTINNDFYSGRSNNNNNNNNHEIYKRKLSNLSSLWSSQKDDIDDSPITPSNTTTTTTTTSTKFDPSILFEDSEFEESDTDTKRAKISQDSQYSQKIIKSPTNTQSQDILKDDYSHRNSNNNINYEESNNQLFLKILSKLERMDQRLLVIESKLERIENHK